MKPLITPAKDDFLQAAEWALENWKPPSPQALTYDSFRVLGGKTDALAQGYLYELTEKFGDQIPLYVAECKRLIIITTRSMIGFENEISHAWLTAAALQDDWVKSDLFINLSDTENLVDLLDFMVLTYLAIASSALSENQIQLALSWVFESSEAHRLCDHLVHADESRKTAKAAIVDLARKGAAAFHDKPGGSRERRQKIQGIWLSGKFETKDLCAREECDALGMSYSAARKALMGLPNPRDLPTA